MVSQAAVQAVFAGQASLIHCLYMGVDVKFIGA